MAPSSSVAYVIVAQGLSHRYTWADVKDLAKTRVTHGLRADLLEQPGGLTIWTIKAIRRNEALSLFDYLSTERFDGRQLTVHLLEETRCIRSNCAVTGLPCGLCASRQNVQRTSQPPPRPPSYSAAYAAPHLGPVSQHVPAIPGTVNTQQLLAAVNELRSRAASGSTLSAEQHAFLQRMAALTVQDPVRPIHMPMPAYGTTTRSGMPVNTSEGFARIESRGVFVQGLDYKTRASELSTFFSRAGQVTHTEIHSDSRGKSKGTATVQYATSAQACAAIRGFHGMLWKSRTLKVRSDRESVVTSPPATGPFAYTSSDSASSASSTRIRTSSPPSSVSDGSEAEDSDESSEEDEGPLIVDGSNRRPESY